MEPPTLEGLVKELRISVDPLDQRCSDEHLKSISLFLDWRSVAPHLGLSERDIADIEAENRTESERRLKVLQQWKRVFGYVATFKNLVLTLLKVRNADDAERVCRLLQTPADAGMTTEFCLSIHLDKYRHSQKWASGCLFSRKYYGHPNAHIYDEYGHPIMKIGILCGCLYSRKFRYPDGHQ